MMCLGKPKLCIKFEVPSFSHCVNIEVKPKKLKNPQILGVTLVLATPTFSSVCDFMTGLGKPPAAHQIEVASPSRCRNIIGEPKIFGSSPSPRPPHLFLWVWFYDGPWKPKLCTKFEVASFSHCRNIKGEAPNFGELPSPRATPTFSSNGI